MKNKLFKRLLIIFFIVFTIGRLLLLYNQNAVKTRALFSWKKDQVLQGSSELFKTMEILKINTLYQRFSSGLEKEDIERFLSKAQELDIKVSFLDGEPEWALEKNASHMIAAIDRVNEINEGLNEDEKIKSIIFDIEPYLLEEWNDESRKEIMDDFVTAAKVMYKRAKESDLEIILCIPYFYDNMSLSKQLEELIKDGSDSIAIMNYLKDKEVSNIKEEVELSDKYSKEVINIYELQAPGEYDLKEKNTYYNDGVKAVEENFKIIRKEFRGKKVSIAFHEYRALKELLDRE